MTEYEFDLSRRKVLGAIGAVGAASAGAGLGTSALFSDQESFEDNRLVAGELDLKMDWEEHYSFPQIYGFPDPTDGLDVRRSEPADTTNYTAMPDPVNPLVWVHNDDLAAYMANTAIEAYPDVDDDGSQDPFGQNGVDDFCTDGADLDGGLDPRGEGAFRTENADTYDAESEAIKPLVSLEDVKPGDFGELTLSLHLCNNPGYIWMNGGLVEAREGGVTEAESDSSDAGPADEVVTDLTQSDGVELLDEIQTIAWYDDCDNVLETGDVTTDGEFADVVIVMDVSGSMSGELDDAQSGANELVAALGPNDQVGLVSFSSSPTSDDTLASTLDIGLTTDHNAVSVAINGLTDGGSTNMEAAIERAHEELLGADTFAEYGESGNARAGARKIMVFLGDGSENEGTDVTDSNNIDPVQEATNAKADGIEIFTIAYGASAPSLSDLASTPNTAGAPEDQYAYAATTADIETVFRNIGGVVSTGGEAIFHQGSLRDFLLKLEDGDGIPLDGDLTVEGRTCFAGLQTHCIGLAWWIPTEVENEIQSDSVSFDVGFYAEQCRNNEQTPALG